MKASNDACQHETLTWGSGDYYLFCRICSRKWALMGDQPEYGQDMHGNRIGADPTKCCPGFRAWDETRTKFKMERVARRPFTIEEE